MHRGVIEHWDLEEQALVPRRPHGAHMTREASAIMTKTKVTLAEQLKTARKEAADAVKARDKATKVAQKALDKVAKLEAKADKAAK
jgi:hypothetical protein